MTIRMGFMMPNTEWENWTDVDFNAVMHIKPTCIVVPLYDVNNPFFATRLVMMQKIRAALPDCTFLWRMMQDKPTLQDPTWWATECNKRIDAIRPYLPETSDIIPWNEPNVEGMGEDWARLISWIRTFMLTISKRSSRIHLPALSPSGNYRAGWLALMEVEQLFDAVDIHIYDPAQWDAASIKHYTSLPLWITEFNRILPSAMISMAGAIAQGAVWFILRGTPDQAQYNLTEPNFSDMVMALMAPTAPSSAPSAPIPPVQVPSFYTPGVDLSSNNGQVNSALLAESGQKFAFIKVTEGNDYVNPLLQQQSDAVRGAGLITAYYHFARADLTTNPMDEVKAFFAALPEKQRPIALDIEKGDGPLQAWCTVWLQEAAQIAGYRPYFYSGAWFMYPHLLHDNNDLQQYPLWLSHPDPTSWPGPIPSWPSVKINQYGQGNVLGIAGMVDLNVFAGSIDEFIASGRP